MQRRLMALLLTVALAFGTLTVTAFGASKFTDIEGNPYQAAIERWSDAGIVRGMTDTEFQPDGALTRAQLAAYLNRINLYKVAAENTFTDVSESDWFYQDILKANAAKIFLGNGDNTMTPNMQLNRETAVTVLARVFGVKESDTVAYEGASISSWAKGFVNGMKEAGLLEGLFADGFNAQKPITRGEFIQLLDNCLPNYITTGTTSLSSATLEEGNVLINVPNVKLSNIDIKGNLIIAEGVGEGDITLENVSVTGTTIVRGGGANSVTLSGNTKLNVVDVFKLGGTVSLKATGTTLIENLTLLADGDKVNVSGKVTNLNAEANTKVNLVGATITNANLKGKGIELVVDGKSTVSKLNVAKEAADAKVEILKGGKVGNLSLAADGVEITGVGRLENVTVSGNNNKIDTNGTKVTVSAGATGNTSFGKALPAGKTTTTEGTLPDSVTSVGSGSGSGSTGAPESSASISVTSVKVGSTELTKEGNTIVVIGSDIANKTVNIALKTSNMTGAKTGTITFNGVTKDISATISSNAATVTYAMPTSITNGNYTMSIKFGGASATLLFDVVTADLLAVRSGLVAVETAAKATSATSVKLSATMTEDQINAAIAAAYASKASGCTVTFAKTAGTITLTTSTVSGKFTVTKGSESVTSNANISVKVTVSQTPAYDYTLTLTPSLAGVYIATVVVNDTSKEVESVTINGSLATKQANGSYSYAFIPTAAQIADPYANITVEIKYATPTPLDVLGTLKAVPDPIEKDTKLLVVAQLKPGASTTNLTVTANGTSLLFDDHPDVNGYYGIIEGKIGDTVTFVATQNGKTQTKTTVAAAVN